MAVSLSGKDPRGPRGGAKGSPDPGPLGLAALTTTPMACAACALRTFWMKSQLPRTCPGRKSPFLMVKRSARPYKSAIQNRFTTENAKAV